MKIGEIAEGEEEVGAGTIPTESVIGEKVRITTKLVR